MQHLIFLRDFLVYCLPTTDEYLNLTSKIYSKNTLPDDFFKRTAVFDYYFILDSKKLNKIGSYYSEKVDDTTETVFRQYRTEITLDILIYQVDLHAKQKARYLANKFISEIPFYVQHEKAKEFLITQTTFKTANIIPAFETEDLSYVESDDSSYLRYRMTFPIDFSTQLNFAVEKIATVDLTHNIIRKNS